MARDRVATVHDTYRSRYLDGAADDPTKVVHECGTITLVASGGEHPIFNVGFVFEPPTADDLREAIRWMTAEGVPFWVNVAEEALPRFEALAADHDIERSDMVLSGMYRPSLEDLPPNASDAEFTEVTTEEEVKTFMRVSNTVFDIEDEDRPDRSSEESGTDDRNHAYLGRVDGEAVAIGGTYLNGEVANVFGMAVREGFRGRGIGTGICSTALQAARDHGCEVATLESTPMAVSVYEALGFETVIKYFLFEVS